MEPASCNSVVSNDILPPSSSTSLYLNCSGIRAWDCYLDRLADFATCTGTLYPPVGGWVGGLPVTTEFMYQNNAIISFLDGPTESTEFFTRVTLIVSKDNQTIYNTYQGTNDGDSWDVDIDLGPDLEYITSGTQSNARWKVKGGWSIHLARRTLSRMQNYLIRTELIGGAVNQTNCNKTTVKRIDMPFGSLGNISIPYPYQRYTAKYMMYSCIDDSNASCTFASTAGSAILVVIMMALFL